MISVLIVDTDELFTKEISWALSNLSDIKFHTLTTNFTELESLIEVHAANILFIGPNWRNESISKLLAPLLERHAEIGTICASQFPELTEFTEYGIGSQRIETIDFPANRRQIVETIREMYASSKNWAIPVSQKDGQRVTTQNPSESPKEDSEGKLITVFSTKGGVGKTVIATNLAVCLAQRFRSNVVILDLDFQFGDVGVTLKLKPKYTIYDAVLMADTLDRNMLSNLLTVNGTGVKALLAPLEPEIADLITSSNTQKIINLAKSMAKYVIIDTPPSFNDHVLAALEVSDFIYLVSTMDIASVKNVKLCLQTLHLLGYPKEKLELIINRMYRKSGLNLDDIEEALEIKAALTVPQDKLVPFSLNKGVPVVLNAPRAPFSKSIYQLSQLLDDRKTSNESGTKVPGKPVKER